jgi:hypothetical protein
MVICWDIDDDGGERRRWHKGLPVECLCVCCVTEAELQAVLPMPAQQGQPLSQQSRTQPRRQRCDGGLDGYLNSSHELGTYSDVWYAAAFGGDAHD